MTLNQLLDQAVLQYPGDIAVRGNDFTYTYQEFHAAAGAFAAHLIRSGVTPGSIVGICTERSPEMLVGIFGILKSGAAYMPIDPSYPPQRIASLLSSAGCSHVVTTSRNVGFIRSFGCQAIVPFQGYAANGSPVNLPATADDDTAYVLFTSGSEGMPKGVMIAHHSVVNLVSYIQDKYPINRGDVVLLKSPYTFDGSVWELFGWIVMGGTLFVAPPGAEKDPKQLWEILHREKIAFLFFVPPMLGAFLGFSSYGEPVDLLPLKWISVGGEVLPSKTVKRFYEVFDHRKTGLINVYGPTETTVYATTHLCTPESSGTKIPIGYPVTNDVVCIMDDDGNELPAGTEGEIWIGGAGVAKGYLNNPELTRQKFIPDPFNGSGLFYRTGDLGYKNEDGTFDFAGRKDLQVKLRGLRIELGEIEYALSRIGEIAECAVTFSRDHNHDDCIVAYVRLKQEPGEEMIPGFALADDALDHAIREQLGNWLPEYMIPSRFIRVRQFPLTSHEKIDRKALPSLTSFPGGEPVAAWLPDTETGKTMLRLWQQVLGKKAFGAGDDFFAAGGHSLKAIHLIALIIGEFGVEVPLHRFYDGLTLQEMTDGINQKSFPEFRKTEQMLPRDDHTGAFPITPVQTEMWILHSLDPSGLIHNIQVEFTLSGSPDPARFRAALQKTMEEEEMFRSVFKPVNGIPYRLVSETLPFHLNESNLSGLESGEKKQTYDRICYDNGRVLFNTETLPLFSLHLIAWSPQEYRLLMAIHHLIFDGWSLYLFMDRLSHRYSGRPVKQHPWRISDYVSYLHQPGVQEKMMEERRYWLNELQHLPRRWFLPLKDDAEPEAAAQHGDRFWWDCGSALSEAIDQTALKLRSTPFALFMTAFQLSLASSNMISDIIVGTPFANRTNEIVNGLIGYYTNMVSIRLTWTPDMPLASLVALCNRKAMMAFSNANLPFGEIARAVGSVSDLGANPVYHTFFVMQNWPHDASSFDALTLKQREIGNFTAKTDFLLNAEKLDDGYGCWLEYDTMLYPESTAGRLSMTINRCLEIITRWPDRNVSQVQTELRQLLHNRSGLRCHVAGEGRLATRCMERLEQKGFDIVNVITNDPWLRNHYPDRWAPGSILSSDPLPLAEVDYIFSINNSLILKQEFLALASTMAINYHDAPLPRYAGMYATNWAILEGSSSHGVTWHKITGMIDGGDLLVTAPVAVLPDDTALTLNTRCFEAAIASFEKLMEDILHDRVHAVPQDITLRTLYPLAMRPARFGSMHPGMSVVEADRLLRATRSGFGFDNEFALPWLFADGDLFILREASAVEGNHGTPGSFGLVNGAAGFFCHDGFIAITALFDTLGHPVDLHQRFSADMVMEIPDPERCARAAAFFKKIARFESFWKNRFEQAGFLSWPFLDGERNVEREIYTLNDEQQQGIETLLNGFDLEDVLIAATLLVLLNLCDRTSGTVGYLPELPDAADDGFFSPWVPFHAGLPAEISATEAIREVITSLKNTCEAKTYVRSVPLRYHQIRSYAGFIPEMDLCKSVSAAARSMAKIRFLVSGNSISLHGPGNHDFPGGADFLRCFRIWLDTFLANPETSLRLISCVDEPAPVSCIAPSSLPEIAHTTAPDVITRFREMANSFPDALAVYDHGQSYSYFTFFHEINALSAVLSSRKVKPDDVVAIAMARNYHHMMSIMAVLQCGACFLPIDPAMPAERIAFILQDAGVALVLVDDDEVLTGTGLPTLNVTSLSFQRTDAQDVTAIVAPGSARAYILYTSGSTGRPKGVIISRGNLAAFVAGALEEYSICPSDKVLQFASLSFDACMEEIFCSFCSGAGLYLRTDEMLQPGELIDFTITHALTVWDLPTAFWRQVVRSEEYRRLAAQSSLRLVIIGGEAVLPADVGAWKEVAAAHRLVNTYGPTETTVVALTYPVTSGLPDHGIVPIGTPLRCCATAVVNRSCMPVPAGIAGELLISGDTVALGYLNRPVEEQKAFNWHALYGDELKRWYHTGDRVFEDSGGQFCFIGRKDQQVKIRGFRVEPSEIEQQIALIRGVSGCAVLVYESASGHNLAAFYTTASRQPLAIPVKEILGGRLPAYMIPGEIQFIEKIPLTPNGKSDLAALAEILNQCRNKEHDQSGNPVTPTEHFLHKLWQEILEIGNPGVGDDFFELGGHSLKAVQLMAEIKKHKGMTIPLATLIQNPTIRKFAACIDAKSNPFQWNCLVPIRKEGDLTPLFLIHGAGMNVLLYQSLVRHLSPRRPIYAFQAAGLDGRRPLKNSIEAMAGEYLEEMLTVQPQGPWYMLGFSLGGFIAYEMAQKLTEKGHRAGFTGMIDSVAYLADFSPSSLKKMFVNTWSSLARPLYTIWLLLQEPAEGKRAFLVNKLKRLRLSVTLLLTRAGINQQHDLQKDLERQDYLSDKVLIYMNEVLRKYRLREAGFFIDLFAAGKPTFYIFDREWYGWKPFARKGFKKHTLAGEHSMLFAPPNDAAFAATLEERLNELENNPGTP